MRRRAYALTVALAALILTGCAASSGAEEPRPPETTQTPGVTPTPAQSPTTATDPGDPSNWVVSDAGVGPFVLGMRLSDAIEIDPSAEEYCGQGSGAHGLVYAAGPLMMSSNTDGVLAEVAWHDVAGPQTAEGIGVGSTTADVLGAFPDATVVHYNAYFLNSGNMYFAFQPGEDEVIDNGEFVDDGTPKPITALAVSVDGGYLWEYCG